MLMLLIQLSYHTMEVAIHHGELLLLNHRQLFVCVVLKALCELHLLRYILPILQIRRNHQILTIILFVRRVLI